MLCTRCGSEVNAGYSFCSKCGSPVHETPPVPGARRGMAADSELPVSQSPHSPIMALMRAILPVVVVLSLVGSFLAADRLTLHWYVPEDTSASVSSLESDVVGLMADASSLRTKVSDTNSDLSSLRSRVSNLESGAGPDFDSLTRDARIANALTIISLVSNYGGSQRFDSPAGEACFAWLMFGDGSGTDCGFTR